MRTQSLTSSESVFKIFIISANWSDCCCCCCPGLVQAPCTGGATDWPNTTSLLYFALPDDDGCCCCCCLCGSGCCCCCFWFCPCGRPPASRACLARPASSAAKYAIAIAQPVQLAGCPFSSQLQHFKSSFLLWSVMYVHSLDSCPRAHLRQRAGMKHWARICPHV